MSPSTAHDIIRAHHGRGSAADVKACYLLAHGRHSEIRAMALALQPVTRGRNLAIAA